MDTGSFTVLDTSRVLDVPTISRPDYADRIPPGIERSADAPVRYVRPRPVGGAWITVPGFGPVYYREPPPVVFVAPVTPR